MQYQKYQTLGIRQAINAKVKIGKKVKVNHELCSSYCIDSHIMFDTSFLRSNFCGYSDPYILVERTITIVGLVAEAHAVVQASS